ncbi:UDP-glucose 4-epimerase GalE [Bordetella sp. 15P40C-2]|uniref:UDP-glucose 4-epimerase GalE n=1 Tax=Bordetella sp. 15P40C-2 TaxID=2572246 RepID=UPI001326A436|nr:UDP-glucose 4-epimerase GalE [Bordetella sp. 15P40C-2]MVW71376.1 UDP-glucose 4-epimerase GalE [Bordetella sp. 15P40C-2]
MNKRLLVTGGAGYIGTHTLVELIENGFSPVVLDNFSNSCPESIRRVEEITGSKIEVFEGDICSSSDLAAVFDHAKATGEIFDAVIHFAGLKAVGESVAQPLRYYETNVGGTLALLKAMDTYGVRNIVFSSSATVYGVPIRLPYDEGHPISPTNPYGWTKAISERVLEDWANTGEGRSAVCLRYFNPIGAHPSGRIGEDPRDTPNNLFPFITQVAVGKRPFLSVFGNDYDTVDGTGVRDYVHVVDLACGHVKAVEFGFTSEGFSAFNLGTGKGTSVLELKHAFEQATQAAVRHEFKARRPGDIAAAFASVQLAEQSLGWRAKKSIDDMCIDGWRWQSSNPDGYTAFAESADQRNT